MISFDYYVTVSDVINFELPIAPPRLTLAYATKPGAD